MAVDARGRGTGAHADLAGEVVAPDGSGPVCLPSAGRRSSAEQAVATAVRCLLEGLYDLAVISASNLRPCPAAVEQPRGAGRTPQQVAAAGGAGIEEAGVQRPGKTGRRCYAGFQVQYVTDGASPVDPGSRVLTRCLEQVRWPGRNSTRFAANQLRPWAADSEQITPGRSMAKQAAARSRQECSCLREHRGEMPERSAGRSPGRGPSVWGAQMHQDLEPLEHLQGRLRH